MIEFSPLKVTESSKEGAILIQFLRIDVGCEMWGLFQSFYVVIVALFDKKRRKMRGDEAENFSAYQKVLAKFFFLGLILRQSDEKFLNITIILKYF